MAETTPLVVPATVTLTIDGNAVTVPKGTLLVEAAKHVATDVPVYCYHAKLGPAGLCRICLVDVEKTPKLQIACNTAAADGMVVHTYGAKVEEGRRAVLEFLLLNHPLDCPICDKGGECDLQDYSMAYGQGNSRLADPKASLPKAVDLGPTIVLDDTRCIVCQRCSRFDDIITHEQSLVVKDRGARDVIATATGAPYVSNFSGNVTELCPVGALTSKTYRFKSRPWDLHRTHTTCTQCSVGCAQFVDVRHGEALRTMSDQEDDARSDGWLCDRGRYNIGFVSDPRRVTSPLLRRGADAWDQISWDDALALVAQKLRESIAARGPSSVAAIGGGRLLNEEAYLLQHLFRALGVERLDWRAGRQSLATPWMAGTYEDLENAQTIVVIGQPPSQTAPVMDLRIRKAVARRGARLVAVGPFSTGSFMPETHVATLDAIDPALFDGRRVAFVWDGIDPAGAHALAVSRDLAARGAHVATFVAGEQPNARGAEAMGMRPRGSGNDTRAIFESARDGSLGVLALFGVNPVLRYADGDLARAALASVPFVVASELFLTESSSLAHLVLPAKSALEKSGHTTDLQGLVQVVAGHLAAPGEALADGEFLVALAAELDVAIPTPDQLERYATESERAGALSAGPAGPAGAAPPAGGAPSEAGATAGLRLAIGAHPFAGGGTVRFDDRLHELRARPLVVLAPVTARAARLDEGDTLDLMTPGGTLAGLAVHVDPTLPEGTALVFDGVPEAPANRLRPGETVTIANVRAARELATAGASSEGRG